MSEYDDIWAKAKAKAENSGLEIVEHGWEQHVIIDEPNNLVYRYPKNKNAAAKLEDEVIIFKELDKITWNVAIPKLLGYDGTRAKYRLVSGQVLDETTLKSLSQGQTAEIGTGLGEFLAILNSAPKSIVKHEAWVQRGTLLEYYTGHITDAPETNRWKQPALEALSKLKKLQGKDVSVPVHGDMHGLNIVIDPKSKKLAGVIDFSEMEIGNRHQDFRKIFMADERFLQPAIKSYAVAGGSKLSAELIRLWAYANEWANACRFESEPSNPTYLRALAHLNRWEQI
jgi:aminoglycoside phosphotransferase (APT) family kinase protein